MQLATTNPEVMGKLIGKLPDQRRERVARSIQTIVKNMPPWKRWLARLRLRRVAKQNLDGLGYDFNFSTDMSSPFAEPKSPDPLPDVPSIDSGSTESSSFDWGSFGKTMGTILGVGATIYGASEQKKLAEDQSRMRQQQATLSTMMDAAQQQQLFNLQKSRTESQNRIDQAQADIYLAQAELERLKVQGQIDDINAVRAAEQRILDAQTRLQEVAINEKASQIQMENEQRRMLIEAGINPDTMLGGKTNWLLWGGIGLATVGVGTFVFIKRKTLFKKKRRGRRR